MRHRIYNSSKYVCFNIRSTKWATPDGQYMTQAHETNSSNLSDIRVLLICLNEKTFAIPVSDIREVNRVTQLTPVEKSHEFVLGLMVLHGNATPLFNLKKILNMSPDALKENAMWVATRGDDQMACFAVDRLLGFNQIRATDLDRVPFLAESEHVRYVTYYARTGKEMIPVLDIRDVFNVKKQDIFSSLNDLH